MPSGVYLRTEFHKNLFRGKIPWNKGKKLGPNLHSPFKKGMTPWIKGKKKENFPQLSNSGVKIGNKPWNKGVPNIKGRGENCHLWKGGITSENEKIRTSIEYRLWREAVFSRDNWTCLKYGIRGIKIHAHHLQNFSQYPELRFAIDNGITLSEKAHREFHNKYGKRNNTKEQMNEFLEQ